MNYIRLKEALTASGHFNTRAGALNVTAVARATGLHQVTLRRILRGDSRNPRVEIVQRICEAAVIDMAEVYEDEAAASLAIPQAVTALTPHEKRLLETFRAMSLSAQKTALRVLAVL